MSKHITLPRGITKARLDGMRHGASEPFALKWLDALSAASAGKSAEECATIAGMSREWIFYQMRRLREHGLEKSLLRGHGGGCTSAITGTVKLEMKRKFQLGSSVPDMQEWLKDSPRKIFMSLEGIYYWKRKLAPRD